MAILAFNSDNILDATVVGKAVLTAGSEGIAADAIGLGSTDAVTFSSVTALDGDFSGDVNANQLLVGVTSSTTGAYDSEVHNRLLFQAVSTRAFTARNASTLADVFNINTSQSIVTVANDLVVGNNGSYSGSLNIESGGSQKLYNLGSEGDTDTEYLETSFNSNVATISAKATGSGVVRDLNFDGHDGNFSGDVTIGGSIDNTDANALLSVSHSGTEQYSFRSTALVPKNTSKSIGLPVARFNNVYSVDGSYSGSLNIESGGSQKLYNLGAEGDADTEYLETSWDGNVATVFNKTTGAGTLRNAEFGNVDSKLSISSSQVNVQVSGGAKFSFGSSTNNTRQTFKPSITDIYECGTTAYRWSNVASVDGDFSGDVVMAANVDFTGLPTADPVVSGRLWNDGGTMKISAG